MNLSKDIPHLGLTKGNFCHPFEPYLYAHYTYEGRQIYDLLKNSPSNDGGNEFEDDTVIFITPAPVSEKTSIMTYIKPIPFLEKQGVILSLDVSKGQISMANGFVCFEIFFLHDNSKKWGFAVTPEHYRLILNKIKQEKYLYWDWMYRYNVYAGENQENFSNLEASTPFFTDWLNNESDIVIDHISEKSLGDLLDFVVYKKIDNPAWFNGKFRSPPFSPL